jgi:hypothetical protein
MRHPRCAAPARASSRPASARTAPVGRGPSRRRHLCGGPPFARSWSPPSPEIGASSPPWPSSGPRPPRLRPPSLLYLTSSRSRPPPSRSPPFPEIGPPPPVVGPAPRAGEQARTSSTWRRGGRTRLHRRPRVDVGASGDGDAEDLAPSRWRSRLPGSRRRTLALDPRDPSIRRASATAVPGDPSIRRASATAVPGDPSIRRASPSASPRRPSIRVHLPPPLARP